MPTPYTMKFIIMVWLALLARVRPVSTMAKPACMNMTRKPVISVHTKLMAILFCPAWFARSAMVRPAFGSAMATSLALPVRPPSGSPLALSSPLGVLIDVRSAAVTGAAAAGACAGAGPAGAWADTGATSDRAQRIASPHSSRVFLFIVIPAPLSSVPCLPEVRRSLRTPEPALASPDRALLVGGIEHPENAEHAHDDADERDHEPCAVAGGQANACHRNH